jgi:hypothetical protein
MNKQVIKTSFCKDTNFSRQELWTHRYVTGISLPAANARLFANTLMGTRRNKDIKHYFCFQNHDLNLFIVA